jgi:hypothetical protein
LSSCWYVARGREDVRPRAVKPRASEAAAFTPPIFEESPHAIGHPLVVAAATQDHHHSDHHGGKQYG